MPPIEEALREELRRVTDAVQPGQLRPLRVPAPGPGWRPRLLLPAAAAAVVAIAVAIGLLAGVSASHRPAPASAPAPAAMPRYYVTLAKASTGLEAVVRDSARGRVTGTALLPQTVAAVGQSVAASADDRTFVISVILTDTSSLPGTVPTLYFRLPVSADGRPGRPVLLPPGVGNAEGLMGMALSPDGTMLALSLEHFGVTTNVVPYGEIQVVNLATGKIRTWTSRNVPGYLPGMPRWETHGALTFTWWHTTSLSTGARALLGVLGLDTSAPGASLLNSTMFLFPATTDYQSAQVMPGDRVIVASSCADIIASRGNQGLARAQIVELSATSGRLIRVLRTQVASFSNTTEEHALSASCAVLSVDPSGDHLLVQAFSLGRIDNGVFTALPGASSGTLGAAAAW
jgi:hypothetical protein